MKLTLDPETVRLLKLESFGRGCSLSDLVDDLVRLAPRRYVLVDRGRGTPGAEGQGASRAQGEPGNLGVVSEAG